MRLINVHSLKLEEFVAEDDIPSYAILSHTWEKEEVSFRDFQSSSRTRLHGWQKLKNFCRLVATMHKLNYAWADTCCIDKSSSAELSEVINSMFTWYRQSAVCMVYLSDVPSDSSKEIFNRHLKNSRWFKRGWTLQELLAPEDVRIHNASWLELGSAKSLEGALIAITGIPHMYLHNGTARAASIAMRMSWAAKRTTTRSEDVAYCLMGLFQVNMPLLYGEGAREAFMRLQSELLRNSDDESIFAWTRWGEKTGMLANSPADFEDSYDIISPQFYTEERGIDQSYELTNRGLKLSLKMCPHPSAHENLPRLYILPLNCYSSRFHRAFGERKLTLTLIGASNDKDSLFFRRIGPMIVRPTFNEACGIFRPTEIHSTLSPSMKLQPVIVRHLDPKDFLSFHKGSVSVYGYFESTYEKTIDRSRFSYLQWWRLLEACDSKYTLQGSTQSQYRRILGDLVKQPKLKIQYDASMSTMPPALVKENEFEQSNHEG